MRAVVLLLPVRVEGGLTAHRHDEVDVAVGVLGEDVGLDSPAGLVIAGTQAVQRPDLREGLVRAGVPIARELDLHDLLLARHGSGLDVDHEVAVGQVLNAGDGYALRQALNLRVFGIYRGTLRRIRGSERIGEVGAAQEISNALGRGA